MPTQSAGSASSACFAGFHRYLIVALWGVAVAALFPRWSSAQVTYADFNTPAANSGQSSATCSANAAPPGALFCFNYTGNGLSFIQDNSYTTTIDPNETGGTAYSLQLTQNTQSQASSVWYAIPQNVASGFTAWYAFKITPGIYPPGDGLAFVIQNAAGGGVDSLALGSRAETGSGLTALGGGGVYVCGGRKPTGRDARQWAIEAEASGAGEIMLTSMDRDGTKSGFDCELTRTIATSVRIPVIASGGAGEPRHFVEVFQQGAADAALAASVFHFGLESVHAIKQELRQSGVPVRLTC